MPLGSMPIRAARAQGASGRVPVLLIGPCPRPFQAAPKISFSRALTPHIFLDVFQTVPYYTTRNVDRDADRIPRPRSKEGRMGAIHRLSDAKVRTARTGRYCDGGGLYLRVEKGKHG